MGAANNRAFLGKRCKLGGFCANFSGGTGVHVRMPARALAVRHAGVPPLSPARCSVRHDVCNQACSVAIFAVTSDRRCGWMLRGHPSTKYTVHPSIVPTAPCAIRQRRARVCGLLLFGSIGAVTHFGHFGQGDTHLDDSRCRRFKLDAAGHPNVDNALDAIHGGGANDVFKVNFKPVLSLNACSGGDRQRQNLSSDNGLR